MAAATPPSILSRIRVATPMLSQQRGAEFARCCTPLRPNDGLISRIPPLPSAALDRSSKQQQQHGAATKASPRDGTAAAAAAAEEKGGPGGTTPRSGQISPRVEPPSEDPFSPHEKAVAAEINRARTNPSQYAAALVQQARLGHPFVLQGPSRTYAQLVELVAQLTKDHEEAAAALAQLEDGQRREVQSYRDQWAIEDAERAKKGKKAPPPKKGKTDAAPTEEVDPEVARTAIIDEIAARNDTQRAALKRTIAEVRRLLDCASQGVAVIKACEQKLLSLKPMGALVYSRGLSLAARDACSEEVGADHTHLCGRYGTLNGSAGFVTHVGGTGGTGGASVAQVVMEMLLCLQDPRRKGRAMLLDGAAQLIGVGWRRSAAGPRTCCAVASGFEELEAISSRAHLPLQDVRRILPLAKQLTDKSVLSVSGGAEHLVQFVTPTSHPAVCGNTFTIRMRRDPSVVLCAALSLAADPEPLAPSFFSGEVFTQKCEGSEDVDINVVLPHAGHFKVTIFAQNTAGGGGSSDATTTTTTGVAAAISGFRKISVVRLHADQWAVNQKWPLYPVASSDFHERQCTLRSPLQGVLAPETEYTFSIVVPRTAYLAGELARITANLERAAAQADGSKEAAAQLVQVCVEAEAELAKAREAQVATAPQLQAELANASRDIAKKRGKDLDKAKTQIAELEEQLRALDAAVEAATQSVAHANERVVQHRRAIRQASAQRRRYTHERSQVVAAADRSAPLRIELSMEERRTQLLSDNAEGTVYSRTVKTPRSGAVSLFIAGLTALTWQVGVF